MERDFLEAHYEISAAIEYALRENNPVVTEPYKQWGYTLRYDLSIAWATEFQQKHEATDWGQQDFVETIEAFIKEKLK